MEAVAIFPPSYIYIYINICLFMCFNYISTCFIIACILLLPKRTAESEREREREREREKERRHCGSNVHNEESIVGRLVGGVVFSASRLS